METKETLAVLFDFDGVIMDTETQYTVFWDEQGRKYLNRGHYGKSIKGQTLKQIYEKDFPGMPDIQELISRDLGNFEENMSYEYIPGIEAFIASLRANGVKMAVVTSSTTKKMKNVYHAHPKFAGLFDEILTAERFSRSKPDPDCFLLGMKLFGSKPEHTFVFEDSFHGLQAGRASGAITIGLATTNSREAIAGKADHIIDDFTEMTYERLLTMM
ncbi:HAD family hydrolase [Bacteroides sp.]